MEPSDHGFGQRKSHSRTIFVGNIPYDATQEQLVDLLQLVGPFISFRLKHDQENQKPKGYGFCEYRDPDIAGSALRNLNGLDLNGRQLRVDFASDNKNGTNLKEEEVKFRDGGEVYNADAKEVFGVSECSNLEDIFKNMSFM